MNIFNPRISILLVDDDAMVRSVLTEYLALMGFKKLHIADDADEALKLIREPKFPIDLIISDWEMPGQTGLSLLRAVRSSTHRKDTPFIMVTSQRSMERIKITQAVQWKVNAYIMKPFRQSLLKQKIWEAMGWAEKKTA